MESFLEHGSRKRDIAQDDIKYRIRQFFLASCGVLWGITVGVIYGYSSIIFDQLRKDKDFYITTEQEGWIASVITLTMIPTNVSIGWVLDKFGRRYTAGLAEIVSLLGLIVTYFSHSYHILIVARLLSGIYIGLSLPIYMTYIGEITTPKYRATCLGLMPLGNSLGVLAVQYLGYYVQWNKLALIFAIIPFYNSAVLCYVKESYIWYINRNEMKQAENAFVWFRGTSEDSREEFYNATEGITEEQNYSLFTVCKMLTQRNFLIPFMVTNVTFLTSQISAGTTLTFYTSNILASITTNEDYQSYTNTMLNTVCLLAVLLGSLLVRKYSVRIILLVNTFILGILVLILSLFMFLSTKYTENTVFSLLALIHIVLIGLFGTMGLGTFELVICAELYPAPVRGIGSALTTTMSSLYLFLTVKLTPDMLERFGGSGFFLILGILTLVGTCVLHFVLPNTRNKTLKQIEDMYVKHEGLTFLN